MDLPGQATGGGSPSPVAVLFFFMIMLMYVSPSGNDIDPGRRVTPGEYVDLKLARESSALHVLNTTQWGDFSLNNEPNDTLAGGGTGTRYLNLTGFRQDDGFSWRRLKHVHRRFDVFRQAYGIPDSKPEDKDGKVAAQYGLYHNVTGLAAGPWVRSQGMGFEDPFRGGGHLNLTHINPDTPWQWSDFNKNVTSSGDSAQFSIGKFDPDFAVTNGHIVLPQREDGEPQMIGGSLVLRDESNYGGWEVPLFGIQWPDTGLLAFTTTSDKFDGLYGLPHLMSSADLFNSSRSVLNETLGKALNYRKSKLGTSFSDFWSYDNMFHPSPHCEYVVFVQIHALRNLQLSSTGGTLQEQILHLEQELRDPDGMPHATPPPLRMSFVAFSPDCDSIIESKGPPSFVPAEGEHLKGYKSEVYISKVRSTLLLFTGVLLLQGWLLLQQSKDASTPSTTSRISYYTICMMMFVDFCVEFATMMAGGEADAIYPGVYLTAFGALTGMLLGGRFIGDIYRFQATERLEAERARARAQAVREAPATAARVDYWNRRAQLGLPIPQAVLEQGIITADGVHIPIQQPARPLAQQAAEADDQPIIIPSDQDIDAEIAENDPPANAPGTLPTPATATPGAGPGPAARAGSQTMSYTNMFAPFFMLGTLFFMITVSALSWSPFYRNCYINLLALLYLSMWWPQILRNVKRNFRKSLRKRFVVGMSVCRLVPLGYFYVWEDNLAFIEPRFGAFAVLVGWVWVQIVVLVAQETVGARLGIGNWLARFVDLPEAWDYHPVIRDDDVEGGGMPIGLVLSSGGNSPNLSRSNTNDESQRKRSDAQHTRSVDCAICMHVLEVPVLAAGRDGEGKGTGGVQGLLERRRYMVTPCRHIFHSECLEGWMRHKLQCPVCRDDLPTL